MGFRAATRMPRSRKCRASSARSDGFADAGVSAGDENGSFHSSRFKLRPPALMPLVRRGRGKFRTRARNRRWWPPGGFQKKIPVHAFADEVHEFFHACTWADSLTPGAISFSHSSRMYFKMSRPGGSELFRPAIRREFGRRARDCGLRRGQSSGHAHRFGRAIPWLARR